MIVPKTAGLRLRSDEVHNALAFEWGHAWRRRRLRGSILLGLLPVLLALLLVILKAIDLPWGDPILIRGVDILPEFFSLGYLQALLVVVPLMLATNLIARERETRTLQLLLVRPLSRASLFLGKYLGTWIVACILLCGSYLLSVLLLLGADGFADAWEMLRNLPAYLIVLCLGAFAYGSLFTLVGMLSKRPALLGLFVAFGWELAIPFLPGLIRNLSVRRHLVAFLPEAALPAPIMAALAPASWIEALLWLLLGCAVCLGIALAVFANRDYA